MGADVAAESRPAANVYARANDVVGFDLRKLCFEGPADKLECTDIQQPAILVTSIALWEALKEEVGEAHGLFEAAAGLSLGEYTALYGAGSLSFDDAVRLVRRRGELMQQAAEAPPSGMVSLIGADESKAQELCDKAAAGEVLVVANLNCPGQVVISGSQAACERAAAAADEFGCRAVALKVAGAFHSPLMQSAADQLGEVLDGIDVKAPQIPVLSNVTGEYHTDADSIRHLLQEQVVRPVRWQSCVERLIAGGFERFVEVGPNRVLTGMMRKIKRRVQAVSIGTLEDVRNQVLLTRA
jgi:[acyl-carrier-protein] S-malonyltransferase